jgi:hypothetical protein
MEGVNYNKELFPNKIVKEFGFGKIRKRSLHLLVVFNQSWNQ